MDIDEQVAAQTANDTGAAYWTADVNKLLSDKQIDVVFITTRHDSHAELTIQSVNAGKHILCEKPMGLNCEECKAAVISYMVNESIKTGMPVSMNECDYAF